MDGPILSCIVMVIFASLAVWWSAYLLEQERKRAHRLVVRAEWDSEAGAWVASSDDVPGLATEAATVEALDTKLKDLVPFLLKANGRPADAAKPIELIARRFTVTTAGG
jgi:predicted RNase H-like HicB family nuclease